MKLKIDFNDIIHAYEHATDHIHYLIDIKSSKLICIDESKDPNTHKQLTEMIRDQRYIRIPARDINDEQFIMEGFIYEPQDFTLADTLYKTLHRKNGSKHFQQMLNENLPLKQQWLTYRSTTLRNETINWLCSNNIELENQNLTPTIQIKELTPKEIQHMPDEIKDFKPYACLHCHNKKGMKARIFSINTSPENKLIEQETQRIMKDQFGITHHGGWSGGEQEFLTASRCTQCGSEEIFWDY